MDELEQSVTQIEALSMKAYELGLEYAPKLALAIVTLLIGLWVIKGITKLVEVSMQSSKVDPTLIPFMSSLVSWMFKVLLFISVASMIGYFLLPFSCRDICSARQKLRTSTTGLCKMKVMATASRFARATASMANRRGHTLQPVSRPTAARIMSPQEALAV